MEEKYFQVEQLLLEFRRVVVAYSGGVDSTFILKAAVNTLGRSNVLAVTGRSPSVASAELEDAKRYARMIGADHEIIDTEEFDNPDYVANPTNRCYYCKTTLYEHLSRIAGVKGFRVVVNGTNADDLTDFRPGLRAAEEYRVRSPAAEAGMGKKEIREWHMRWGLPIHDKPAAPCLSSRVQYGETITSEKLRRIEAAESFLRELGFRECRVRLHDSIARLEIPPADFARLLQDGLAARIDARFRELGFRYATLDLRGFRSGSMNDVVKLRLGKRGRESFDESTGLG